ncbi:hypothetical protein V2A60_004882 [Cordyceps javanica]|uniref:DNA replication regulator Sld3 n=1 Tax=Cordyceps javanica TaxID=43265 RepID=A0A545VCF7_9HYPO|nr:DNA replication regulator Sld3 [Cordyceps javanica]TQW10915.1 DNA replication regulator Sld3 [Cordyceps javanica]
MSSSAAPDDRGASRPRSGILTPSSDGSLNYAATTSPAAPAKRRPDPAMERLLKPSIAVKPHPHALHIQPKTLSPLLVLRRQNLPLGCLDFQSTTAESAYTRLVESRIKILDLETRMGSPQSVLVARHDATRAVYALERQNDGLYAICRLGAWVDLGRLAQHATALCADRVFPAKADAPPVVSDAAMTTPHMSSLQRKKRAAIEAIQSLVRKKPKAEEPEPGLPSGDEVPTPEAAQPRVSGQMPRSTSGGIRDLCVKQSIEESPMPEIMIPHIKHNDEEVPLPVTKTDGDEPLLERTPAADAMTVKAHPISGEIKVENLAVDAVSAVPSSQLHARATDDDPQDVAAKIFENIRAHYFEALYKSMGSLAYFAKGPLSRARSAFHIDLESNLDMADLIEFLKSLVLTTIQIDKKYRETAPEIISQLSALVGSSDESHSRKRKPKKMKLGKNGLFPGEEDRIRKWWNANKPELDEEQPQFTTMQIKSHLSLLRTRETQLQMILIMEILALEPLKAADDAADSSLPLLPGVSASQSHHRSPAAAQTKKRNRHNLPVLIDVHADRLTIWQSTATDEQQLAEDSQANRHSINGNQVEKASLEPLKDFCTDVVVPFFSARIPEMCDAINKKLGGPVIVPAGGSKSQKRSASKKEQKPGSATKRPAAPRPQKTLQRALSTDQHSRRSVSRGPSNMIALMRSATSTSLPTIKREGSESTSLRRLPKVEGATDSQKRLSLSRSSSSLASQDVSRASKKAMVDAQVKDAIAALRKPNREVVGQAMEEADQQRALAAKKARKMQRSSVVKATPANNRFRDVFAHDHEYPDTPGPYMEDVIPPSSLGPFIPSTGQRNSFRNPMDLNTSPALDTVGSTPTKNRAATALFLHRSHDEPCVPPSPLARVRNDPATRLLPLSTSLSANHQPQLSKVGDEGAENHQQQQNRDRDHVFATPAKKHHQQHHKQLQQPLQGQIKAQKSIYETLGWDDDYDDI